MYQITIYTDGAARNNPGPGGYGVILEWNGKRKELSAGYRYTTNNRMELWAVIAGLQALSKPHCQIKIYSDSKYVVDAVEKKWLDNWIKKGFKGKKNEDLWRLYHAISRSHDIKFQWIKGHNEIADNERCDMLATQAADGPNLLIDEVYEKTMAKDHPSLG